MRDEAGAGVRGGRRAPVYSECLSAWLEPGVSRRVAPRRSFLSTPFLHLQNLVVGSLGVLTHGSAGTRGGAVSPGHVATGEQVKEGSTGVLRCSGGKQSVSTVE